MLTLHQGYEGIFVAGGIGSGKTTGPAAQIQHRAIALGCGALWLAAKPEEADRVEKIAARHGRSRDVRRITPGGVWKLDLLDYAASMPGGVENAAQLLDNVVEVGNRKQGKGDEPFWKLGAQRIIRRAIPVVRHALGRSSFSNVYDFITSAPQSPEQVRDPKWACESTCARFLGALPASGLDRNLKLCVDFWLQEWP